MSCFKYSIANACGHVHAIMYRHCGEHSDEVTEMARCFEANHDTTMPRTKVRMGNDYCNRGCEAMTVGWKCCTCGFRSVTGYYHPTARMLVHDDPYGNQHGFCNKCLTENEFIVKEADSNALMDMSTTEYKNGCITPPESCTIPGDSESVSGSSESGSSVTTNNGVSENMEIKLNRIMELLDATVDHMGTHYDVMPLEPAQTTMNPITITRSC